jgi:hypothetical protein
VVKEVACLGIFVLMGLLFLAFLTTLRPSAIAVVQGVEVIDGAPMKHIGTPGRLLTNRDPTQKARTHWAVEISMHQAR